MNSFAAIIALWPTAAELGVDLHVAAGTVRKWGERNSIPAEYWGRLIDAASRRGFAGVDHKLLTNLAAAARARPAPAEPAAAE